MQTVIPALPGYATLKVYMFIRGDEFGYDRETVIAWRITAGDPYPVPVTIEGYVGDWATILQPDGRVCAQGDRDYDCLHDWETAEKRFWEERANQAEVSIRQA